MWISYIWIMLELEFFIATVLKKQQNCVQSHTMQSKRTILRENKNKINIIYTEQVLYQTRNLLLNKEKYSLQHSHLTLTVKRNA